MSHYANIIIALDQHTQEEVFEFVQLLNPALCHLKVGSVLFTHYGPKLVEQLMMRGFSIFLDLKFHDIPQTVAGACRAAAELGVWMLTVHTSGSREMLVAAAQAVRTSHLPHRPLVVGVTVLTSLNDQDLLTLGYHDTMTSLVLRMAKIALDSGLDGVVCSAQEAHLLRQHLPHDFLLVTPGIRLPEDADQDQKRIMTPQGAIAAGSNYLVIGRSITQAQNPQQVLEKIFENQCQK